MGILSKLFGKRGGTDVAAGSQPAPEKLFATVELRSPHLLVFDLPSEGVKFEIPDFQPGIYRIPLSAIVKTTRTDPDAADVIAVDTGVMYFIDAEYEDRFRQVETQLFEETGDSYSLVETPEAYQDDIGIKFDCLPAPGVDSGYAFEGDGAYELNIAMIEKMV
jgi:hypothetical protein